MKAITLNNGMVAKVDDEDFDMLSKFEWIATKGNGRVWRAYCTISMTGLVLKAPDGKCVDHKDRDGLNNQKNNLRIASRSQNQANIPKRQNRAMQSRYKGVSWGCRKNSWRAKIRVGGKGYYLGVFASEEAAARAYDTAAIKHFGEFAILNFPNI